MSIPHHPQDCRKQRHWCGFRYVDGKTIYRNGKPLLYTAAALCFLLQKAWVYRDNLLHRSLWRKGFQTRFPYAAQSVIIVCFRNAVAGTPIDDTHACGTVLAFPDLCSPFL